MSLAHFLRRTPALPRPTLLAPDGPVPWQFRARPALFVTVSAIVIVLLSLGTLVLVRRFTGAFPGELAPDVMLSLALTSMILLAVARIAWRRSFPLETPADLGPIDQVLGWGSSLALGLLAVGCCYPANRNVDWLIWVPILVADQFWRQNFFDAGKPWVPPVEDANVANSSFARADSAHQESILQQLYRLQDDSQIEVIYGTLRADFVTGQRTAVVHVGFCPPLSYLPEIEAEAFSGPASQIKVVQAYAHGTRLDVRLATSATDACHVWIDMAARPQGALGEVHSA